MSSCNGCLYKKTRIEMIAPNVSGSVDWCTKLNKEALYKCAFYNTWSNFLTRMFGVK